MRPRTLPRTVSESSSETSDDGRLPSHRDRDTEPPETHFQGILGASMMKCAIPQRHSSAGLASHPARPHHDRLDWRILRLAAMNFCFPLAFGFFAPGSDYIQHLLYPACRLRSRLVSLELPPGHHCYSAAAIYSCDFRSSAFFFLIFCGFF